MVNRCIPKITTKFTSQAGVLVRDHVPISIREWHKPKKAENEASYVNDAMKKFLWETLLTRFSLPEDMTEGQKNKVKEWTLKKMAIQFQTWKKNLWDKYKNEDPVFDDNLVKIKDHWQEFKRYKQSSTFVSRSVTNKKNASKKTIWHHMGSGGYKTAIPRWIAYENELMAAGITPQTWDWPERSKFWLFAHGAGLDPKTGLIVAEGKWKEKIEEIVPKLVAAIEQVRKGEYIPDRENDELTLALGNPEHVGRVRARPGLTMKEAFPESADTYRSRSRKKKKDADALKELLNRVSALEKNQRPPDQPMFLQDPQADAAPSQRRSSVGSTHLDGCGGSYPVDYVTEKTDCELYMLFRNASVKVALGYVYPSEDGATHHHMPIPPGCVRVGVDEVVPAFETVELDIPRGDDEKTLADVKHGFALWPKKHIVLLQRPPTPHSSPHEHQRPSTPPPSTPHEQQSPHLPETDPSVSPPPRDPPRKTAPGKRNGTPPKKRSRKEKPLPPIEKLPWEKTPEENQEAVESQLRAFFAKKEPEIPFEKTLDPVKVRRTVENLYNPEPSPPSDYRRSIERSYDDMMEAKNPTTSSGIKEIKGIHQVYQLGQQPVKPVPPLKVFDEKAVQSSRQISTDYAAICSRERFGQESQQATNKSKMLECKRDEITDIGFIDPNTMHVRTIEEPLYNKDTPETLLRYEEGASIARGGEEQLDKKIDVKLDMELAMKLDMKTSHGSTREEREACTREEDEFQTGAPGPRPGSTGRQTGPARRRSDPQLVSIGHYPRNKDVADVMKWREYEALRNEMQREFRTQDDELRGTVQGISQKLDATNETVTTMQDQMTDIQRSLQILQLAVDNLTQQQQQGEEDPELQDEAPGVGRGVGRGNRGRGFVELGARRVPPQQQDDGLGKPKFSIPKFEGGADVEEYITWELKIEKLWRLHDYTEDMKVKLLLPHNLMAMHCFGGIELHVLVKKITSCQQGVKTVDTYFMEMEMLMQRGRVRSSLEMTMQRFLHGLKYDIKGIVRHHSYTTMNELLHHAKEAESQLAEEAQIKGRATGAGRFTPREPPSTAPTPSSRSAPYSTPSSKPVSNVSNTKNPEPAASTSGSSMSAARNRDMNCHTCGGKGHFKRDCPNRKVMILNEDNEYETGDDVDPYAPKDDDYDSDGVDAYPSDARTIVVSQRALNVLPSASTQRCNLFKTKALVGPDKACKVIIDGGSCRNLASKELCTKLKLKYLPHPHPYYIQWLSDNGEMKVNHMVRVEFEIGPYKDSIDFDVVPMTVCHLLLGRPWLYDRSVQHNGRTNTYHLEFKGKKINLQRMSPQQIVNESHQKIEVNLEDAPIDRRENCNAMSDIMKSERVNSLVLLATKEDMREFSEDPTAMPLVLMYKGEVLVSNDMTPISLGVSSVLQEFSDVFLEEVPAGLPPLRGIEHQIDLIPGASLPNRAPYRTNSEETKEIQKQESHAGGLMGHFGREKTLLMLADHFYWPKMRRDVDRYVKRCITCNKSKSKLKPHELCPFEVVYGFKPITPLDLLPLPIHERVNMEASKMTDFVRKIHVKTKELIEKKGKNNVARVNKKCKEMLFKPGDMV
ncbi:hypothetical protein QYE76_062956 [Lolium multiflorum]|uniref:CCHC-type domain-containing protein n=1 Tax=Lolium multiflorum TaxID=4521 RepID=A0AAD8W641_LOLMU|nr:hypothetical protein QYE76_062956 [Lolium multiflorum]